MDGSGYPRGLNQAPSARREGCWERPIAMQRQRSHGHTELQLAPEQAAAALGSAFGEGRLDADAVQAVSEAAGHRTRGAASSPLG